MKSTTTARMPETTLIRVTLSISSPQRGLAPLALQFPSTTFVDWLLDSVGLSCCLQVVHLHIPSCYWPVRKSEQLHSRGSRTAQKGYCSETEQRPCEKMQPIRAGQRQIPNRVGRKNTPPRNSPSWSDLPVQKPALLCNSVWKARTGL